MINPNIRRRVARKQCDESAYQERSAGSDGQNVITQLENSSTLSGVLNNQRDDASPSSRTDIIEKGFSQPAFRRNPIEDQIHRYVKWRLRIMKFGGTSVGNASCIRKVVEIIRAASRENNVVVVVSALTGVTNKLIEVATQSGAGNSKQVAAILQELRQRHEDTAGALIHSSAERNRIVGEIRALFEEADRLCHATVLRRELTPEVRASILSFGERLSAPLVAAALAERGIASEAIEATELIITDAHHGAAEPQVDLTRDRCEVRLRPILQKGIVPVVTGFIGSTTENVLTTLGRGSSDYSATIVGAALNASEVVIWTDVDGVLTADPRLLPQARTIPEISYREATDLAYFGAKVLHPKALRPVIPLGIPVWIRNTFAPERPGTRITLAGDANSRGVKGLTAISDVALIVVEGPRIAGMKDALARIFTTTVAVRADVLLISQSSSESNVCFIVSSALAERTAKALRREFAHDLACGKIQSIVSKPAVAIVTVVGQNIHSTSEAASRTFGALDRKNVNIVAIAQGSSHYSLSFVVFEKDMQIALAAIHSEFGLGRSHPRALSIASD